MISLKKEDLLNRDILVYFEFILHLSYQDSKSSTVPLFYAALSILPASLNWIKSATLNSTRILTIVWIVFCKNGLYGINSKMLQKERCFESWENMKSMENTEIR